MWKTGSALKKTPGQTMLYGFIEVFTFGLDADSLRLLWLALSFGVVASVWLGGARGGEADESEKTKERLETAFHTFSNLVALYTSHLDAAKSAKVEPIVAGEGLSDVAKKSQNSTRDSVEQSTRGSTQDDESRAPQAQTGELQNAKINAVEFWREDYWNFDFNLEGDLFAADEEKKENADAWKESLKEEEDEKKEKEDSKDEEEEDDEEQDRGRSNYFGAFFRNRNYPPDVTDPDVQERKKERDADAPSRWRRREDAADDATGKDASLTDGLPNASDESNFAPFDDESAEREAEDWEDSQEPIPWNEGPDFDYLEDETVSLDDKIVYLRKRVEEGDEESRVELARMLIQKAAISGARDEGKALGNLDEAERILREIGAQRDEDAYDDGEYSELLGQALLQRPVFYLRNGLTPPMKAANDALNQIRSWAENSFSFESRRLLATAWQTHGNCLLASGGDSSALSSFRASRDAFESLVDEGCEEAEPSLAFVAASTAEAYASIGDFPKALASYREALTVLDKYSDQEGFLAEKVNVFFRMSSVFRRAGKDEDAVRALQDALESEERLVSFNESVYFAPLTQLLETHAELLASKGNYEDAVASLDRAVSTLKRVLAYDSALSRRVLAYAHIENVLRRRASLYLWRRRYARAAQDVGESLEYLTLAVKKEDAFNPSLQIVFSSCLLYDLCATQGLWDYAAKTQESLERILTRFTPEEHKRVATLYAQLLMQRHVLLTRADRGSEALNATDKAIETLEKLRDDDLNDGGAFRDSLLAKAYCQRAAFCARSNGKTKRENVLDDYRRARELSECELSNGKAGSEFYLFYLDLLEQKASTELRENLFDAMEGDLKQGVSIVVGLLSGRRWRFLDELAKLSRLVIIWARLSKSDLFALRVVRLFLAYARKLRRRYVDNDWVDDEQESDSPQSRTILMNLEAFVVDMRRARADLLELCEWNDELTQFCEFGEFDSRRTANRRDASVNEQKDDETTFDLERERERFVRETLADDPRTRTVFLDYEFGLRAVMRRVASGEIDLANVLYVFLDKTTDLYIAQNESFLAAEETCDVVKIFDRILEERRYCAEKDESPASGADEEENRFWTLAFPFWELQAALLARTSLEALETQNSDENKAQENDVAQDADASKRAEISRLLINVASMRTEVAYMKAIRAVKKIPLFNPLAFTRPGVVVGAYFAWLVRMRRVDEGVAFARAEGAALERRFANLPIGFLAIGTYYDAVSQVALDSADERVFAKDCLLKVHDALENNRAFVGGKTPPPLLERLGNVERRLATIAARDGDEAETDRRLRSSANYYAQCVFKGRFHKQIFAGFAEVLCVLFNSDDVENGKLASVLFHKLEKHAKSWSKKARHESLSATWALTSQAAAYYDRKRGCFYEANRVYQERDALIGEFLSDASNIGFHMVEEKFVEANFYMANGAGSRAIEALETAINVRRIHLVTLEQLKILTGSEDNFPFQFVFDGFQRQIDYANASLANLEIWRTGNREKGRKIVDETLSSMEEKPEVAARVLMTEQTTGETALFFAEFGARVAGIFRKRTEEDESTRKKQLLEDESNSYLQAYFVVRGYAAVLEIDVSGYDLARESLLKLIREIRLNLGRDSHTEKTCLYYWADAAVEAERYDDAIQFASRLFRKGKLSKDNAATYLPYYVDALKISAFARLQRRRFGDLRLAEREVRRSLELLYSEFRARRFALRSSFAEALFLRAMIEQARGRDEEALKDAERAARLMKRARQRGVGTGTRYIETLTEPFLISLRAKLNKTPNFKEGRDDVK